METVSARFVIVSSIPPVRVTCASVPFAEDCRVIDVGSNTVTFTISGYLKVRIPVFMSKSKLPSNGPDVSSTTMAAPALLG